MRSRLPLRARLASVCAVAVIIGACAQEATPSASQSVATVPETTEIATAATARSEAVAPGPFEPGGDTTDAASRPSAPVTVDTSVPEPVPRVLIDTDLGGGIEEVRGDADDIQSLVRAIHYSDALDIEGIVSTEAPGTARPELISEWIKRTDVDHLRSQGYSDLMTEAELLATVKTGTRHRDGPSDGAATDGSRHIIARAHAGSNDDPLWVLVWGSLGTVAQALHDDSSIIPKIRLYSIGDFNSRANIDAREFLVGLLDDHPELWWVENGVLPFQSRSTYRGVFEGGNQSRQWNAVSFVDRHIRGHGTTAGGAFSQKLGDAFPGATGPRSVVGGLKEGDSPSLLYLLSPQFGGVGDLDDPTQPSWGGRFRRSSPETPNYYIDLDCPTPERCQETISRHRVAFLSHWRDRWDRYDEPNQ